MILLICEYLFAHGHIYLGKRRREDCVGDSLMVRNIGPQETADKQRCRPHCHDVRTRIGTSEKKGEEDSHRKKKEVDVPEIAHL